MDSSQRDLQAKGKLFSNFEFILEFLAENRKIFKRIERCEYWSKLNIVIIYQWI